MNNKEQQPKKKPATKAKAPTKKLGIKKQETTEDIINKAIKASEDKWQLKFESFQEKLTESISKQIETALSSEGGLSSQINKLITSTQSLEKLNDLPRRMDNKIDPLVTQGKSYIKDKELKAHENEKSLVSEQKENLIQRQKNLDEEKSQHGSNLEREQKFKEKMEYLDEKIKDNNEKMDDLQSISHDILDILTSQSDESSNLQKELDQTKENLSHVKAQMETQPKQNHGTYQVFGDDYKWFCTYNQEDAELEGWALKNKKQFYGIDDCLKMSVIEFENNETGEKHSLEPQHLCITNIADLKDACDHINYEKIRILKKILDFFTFIY